MKKIIILFLFIVASMPLKAQFFCEDFEYPAGDTINSHGWVKFSGIGINPVIVTSPGLEHSCYSPTFGNSAYLTTTGEDSYRILPHLTDSGSVYVSFLVKFVAAQTGDFFFHLGDSVANNSNKIGRVYAKLSSGKVALGLAKDNENPVYTAGIYDFGKTYIVILKYEFVSGGNSNDLVSLVVDEECPPCQEPPPTLGPLGNGENDLPNIGKVVLQQGAGSKSPTLYIDGICMDTYWCNSALPVEMSSFTSSVSNNMVTLNWNTSSELNNKGFEVERQFSEGQWTKIGFVAGNGTTSSQHSYSYTDRNLNSGSYDYRLKQIDYNGNTTYYNLYGAVSVGTPVSFEMSQNYPNPFNPETKIDYGLPKDVNLQIKVYDISGKEIMTLVSGYEQVGYHTIKFNAANLSSGIYIYSMNIIDNGNSFMITRKMNVIK